MWQETTVFPVALRPPGPHRDLVPFFSLEALPLVAPVPAQ